MDIIAIIPFPTLFQGILNQRVCDLMHSIKVVRLYHGFDLLDYKTYKKQITLAQTRRLNNLVKDDLLADNRHIDSARMSQIMLVSILIKIFRLVIIMTCLSYFTGLIWYIFCNFFAQEDFSNFESPDIEDSYVVQYGITEDVPNSTYYLVISLTYYAFTTLSTVGLGDFHPKQNAERIFCAMIMLFGVMITSFVMDNFSKMIQELNNFNKSYDESNRFNLFIGTMKKLNEDTPLKPRIISRMERYFNFRWQFDRNLGISSEADVDLYEQLPGKIRTEIYVNYLFKDFMRIFSNLMNLHMSHHVYKR
mmetsp:Transcript_5468/g.8509  ORF Transcript_5468/g.8509 Transcript_5468/m.8509 type:complete len:306 (+) Transcript_5468:1462-2379(+)